MLATVLELACDEAAALLLRVGESGPGGHTPASAHLHHLQPPSAPPASLQLPEGQGRWPRPTFVWVQQNLVTIVTIY